MHRNMHRVAVQSHSACMLVDSQCSLQYATVDSMHVCTSSAVSFEES